MEEEKNKILKQLSSDLSKINMDSYLFEMKNSSGTTECIDISLKFCEIINSVKAETYSNLKDALESFIKNKVGFDRICQSLKNDISSLNSNIKTIKTIITQSKTKIKSLSTNLNDLNSNLNLLNSNLKKKKYSLAESRIEKLIQLKETMSINIKKIDNFQQEILDEIKPKNDSKSLLNKRTLTGNVSVKTLITPSPNYEFSPLKTETNCAPSISCQTTKNYNKNTFCAKKINRTTNSKNMIRKRDLSLSVNNSRSSSNMKGYNTITNFKKNIYNTIKNIDDKKEIDDLNRKIANLRSINEKLRKEIDKLKKNANKNINNNSFNITNENITNNLKNLSANLNQNILIYNDKINKTSDLIFSLTLLFNGLQNKCKTIPLIDKEFSDIKQKLLEITTQISELKSRLLEISFQKDGLINNNSIFQTNDNFNISNSNIFSQILDNDESKDNLTQNMSSIMSSTSNNHINDLKKDNSALQTSIDSLNSQILALTSKLNNEQKSKQNLQKNFEILKIEKEELQQKVNSFNKTRLQTSSSSLHSHSNSQMFNNNDSNFLNNSNISNSKSISEISALKEQLRLSEKKYLELKGMYDSDTESKNLIENLLKKNLEDIKKANEQKINKLKKKIEDKDKEINLLKEQHDNEEMTLLNKIKQDNMENIEKLKNLYENKISKDEVNKIEKKYLKEIEKLNTEISKLKSEKELFKNDFSLENSINLSFSSNLNNLNAIEEYKKKFDTIFKEKSSLQKKLEEIESKYEEEKSIVKENNSKNLSEISNLRDEVLKYQISENKLKAQIFEISSENNKLNSQKISNENELKELKQKNTELLSQINNGIESNNIELENIKKEKQKILKEKNELENNNENLANEKNQLKEKIKTIEEELNKIKNEKNKLEEKITGLENEINNLNNEKVKYEKMSNDLREKVEKNKKEIITILTNNTKEKKKLEEQYNSSIINMKEEIQERIRKHEQLSKDYSELQKKLFEIENKNKNTQGKFSIENTIKFDINSKNLKKFLDNLEKISEIVLFFEKNLKNSQHSKRKQSASVSAGGDECEEDEELDLNEDEEIFLNRVKALNKALKKDSDEMKNFKKENRKIIMRLEDALDDNDDLKEKMLKIEEVVNKKQNELYTTLKINFCTLINDFNLNQTNKNSLILFMKLIQFSDDEITNYYNILKKKKK